MASEAKHTPEFASEWRIGPASRGPWAFSIYTGSDIGDGKGVIIADLVGDDKPAVRSRAHLIAASPDMYEALRSINKVASPCADGRTIDDVIRDLDYIVSTARAAIARAEGRSNA